MITREILEPELQPSLRDLKRHLRITSSDLDDQLVLCLRAAVLNAEHFTGRGLAPSRFAYSAPFALSTELPMTDKDFYPAGNIRAQVDGEAADVASDGSIITFPEGKTGETLRVEYTCRPPQVEDDIKAAILLTAAKFFTNPVDSVEGMPSVATNLLSHYRRYGR